MGVCHRCGSSSGPLEYVVLASNGADMPVMAHKYRTDCIDVFRAEILLLRAAIRAADAMAEAAARLSVDLPDPTPTLDATLAAYRDARGKVA